MGLVWCFRRNPWYFRGSPMGLLWDFYGMTVVNFHETSKRAHIGLLWDFDGASVRAPWGLCGNHMGLPYNTAAVLPWIPVQRTAMGLIVIPWKGHGSAPWKPHGTSTEHMRLPISHRSSMGLPRCFRGFRGSPPMRLSSDFHGASVCVPRDFMTPKLPWDSYGTPMGLPWGLRGASMGFPRDFLKMIPGIIYTMIVLP